MATDAHDPTAHHSVISLSLQRPDSPAQTAYLAYSHESAWPRLHPACESFLGTEEAAYYASLPYPVRQKSYLLGRYSAKLALARALGLAHPSGTPPHSILRPLEIRFGIFGQPIPSTPYPTSWEISITHHTPWAVALAAPAGHPIAIDLEAITPERFQTLLSQLTPEETPFVHAAGTSDIAIGTRVTLLWTAKEALSKILRCGLMIPLDLLATEHVKPMPSTEPTSIKPSQPWQQCQQWHGVYKNFPQYQFLSWQTSSAILSIALPKRTTLSAPSLSSLWGSMLEPTL